MVVSGGNKLRHVTVSGFPPSDSLIGFWENDVLIDQDVEPIARPDFERGLDIEVFRHGLLRDLSEGFGKGPPGSIRRAVRRRRGATIFREQHVRPGADQGNENR